VLSYSQGYSIDPWLFLASKKVQSKRYTSHKNVKLTKVSSNFLTVQIFGKLSASYHMLRWHDHISLSSSPIQREPLSLR